MFFWGFKNKPDSVSLSGYQGPWKLFPNIYLPIHFFHLSYAILFSLCKALLIIYMHSQTNFKFLEPGSTFYTVCIGKAYEYIIQNKQQNYAQELSFTYNMTESILLAVFS